MAVVRRFKPCQTTAVYNGRAADDCRATRQCHYLFSNVMRKRNLPGGGGTPYN